MSTVGGTSSSGSSSGVASTNKNKQSTDDALSGLGLGDFLKLMIAELQNQDPLNPLDNAQMLQQIGQMRQISSNDKLTKTLDAVLLGQNLTSATSLIGKNIEGLDDASKSVVGKVDSVSVADGVTKVHVGTQTVSLTNIRQVVPAGVDIAATTNDGAAADGA